ncbi:MAG TPA: DegV family protein [Smithellaceae bacterium]|nr:DegV family protein [Smithellaceae bacterium]HRV46056.1 DegV family protein [Smithellaceae bacterium]
MENRFRQSFVAGVERVAAWADLLDAINVYPVADGDTGRNLSVSLSPLRQADGEKDKIVRQLLLAARGNSGNIASQFFSVFYAADFPANLKETVQAANKKAWKAVGDPRPGTMLSVFDALEEALSEQEVFSDREGVDRVVALLEKAVRETRETLPKLKQAGVVDAGALGMYIFFEGFFRTLAGLDNSYRPVTEVFPGFLAISSSFHETLASGYCVDFVVKADASAEDLAQLAAGQESAVILRDGDLCKIHLHTDDREKIRARMGALGSVMAWEDDNLALQIRDFMNAPADTSLHILTDAAGSLTREDAKKHGFTLLNSYLNVGDQSIPETYFHPAELYRAMSAGVKVSTSQASVFERHQCYASELARFEKVLYLCVGSVFTGNYNVAMEWKKKHDPDNRLTVIDTGAASGRLGVMVLATQRFLLRTKDMDAAIAFARKAAERCEEYVFLEKLQYLAAGGRLSKTGAFFGDMLKMKPVISPQPEGAKKMGVVRNRADQIRMALDKLAAVLAPDSSAFIMLEYSDNIEQVSEFRHQVQNLYPKAEIILQPLSLTSGAHMGPGTWGIAFLKREE